MVIAVDAGGTSSRTAVVGTDGACLGLGFAGSANPLSSGDPKAAESIGSGTSAALAAGGVDPDSVAVVVVAAAGGGHRPAFTGLVAETLAPLGVSAPVVLAADGHAAFASGTHLESGYVIVSGTGAVAHRIESGRSVRHSDGLGWLLGDVGSGFWIGLHVARAVLFDLDGRGPRTAMSPLLLAELGLDPDDRSLDEKGRPRVMRAIEMALYGDLPVRAARFASICFRVPGDAVAEEILSGAARGLAATLRTVMVPTLDGPVIAGGGLLANPTGLLERLARELGEPVASRLQPVPDGIVGACVIALRHVGVVVDDQVFRTIAATVTERRPG